MFVCVCAFSRAGRPIKVSMRTHARVHKRFECARERTRTPVVFDGIERRRAAATAPADGFECEKRAAKNY